MKSIDWVDIELQEMFSRHGLMVTGHSFMQNEVLFTTRAVPAPPTVLREVDILLSPFVDRPLGLEEAAFNWRQNDPVALRHADYISGGISWAMLDKDIIRIIFTKANAHGTKWVTSLVLLLTPN